MTHTWHSITWDELRAAGIVPPPTMTAKGQPQRCGEDFRIVFPSGNVYEFMRVLKCHRCGGRLNGVVSHACATEDDLCAKCVKELTT